LRVIAPYVETKANLGKDLKGINDTADTSELEISTIGNAEVNQERNTLKMY